MKRILLFAAAIAGLISAASCQKENLEPIAKANTVTYTVQVADAVATKAIGDKINTVNELVYEVYRTEAEEVEDFVKADANLLYHSTAVINDGVATLDLEFVNDQNFIVLFWAHVAGNKVYDVKDLTNVTITSQNVANNVDAQAFVGRDFVTDCDSGAQGKVTLHRPISQLNIGTTEASLTGSPVPFKNPIKLNGSTVKVTGLATTFDIAQMCATGKPATEYTYTTDELNDTDPKVPAGDLTVANVDYAYVAMNYVGFAANEGSTVKVSYVINTTEGDIDNVIENVPVKPNYRTNIIGNLITSKSEYTIELDDEWGTPNAGETFIVKTDEELAAAIKSDAEVVEIILGADLNISAANAAAIAGANTQKITIKGNKALTRSTAAEYYTLTIKDAYNNVVKAVNPEAELVLQDLNLTSNKASGTWDTYDILFKNDVTLKNVNALQSIALDDTVQNAEFENLTITESHDYYALWICAAEMNVEWKGGAVNCPNGRGVKIDDEYLETPGHTTLKIEDVVFNTAKKAAIVVKSSAEVTVNTTNIDITNTVDPINEVWVDEDAAAYFEKVIVNDTTDKALEGSGDVPVVVSTPQELQAAINAAKEGKNLIYFKNVIISDTNITVLQEVGVNIIIDGNDKEFDGTFILEGGSQGNSTETLTFQNINFKHEETGEFYFIDANSADVAKRYVHNVTVDRCTFTGSTNAVALRFRQAYNLIVSNTSVVSGHSLLQAYGTTGIVIDNVEVVAGRGVSLGSSTGVTIKDSEFKVASYGVRGNGDGNSYDINIAVQDSEIEANQPIVIRKVTDANHTYAISFTGTTLNALSEDGYQVVLTNGADDAEYVKPTGTYTLTGADTFSVYPRDYYYPVATWADFTAALAANEAKIRLDADITYDANYQLQKAVTIDLNGKSMTLPMINIHTKTTIKNGTINGKVYARKNAEIVFDNVTFSGAVADNLSTEGHLQVQGGCKSLYAKDCLFSPTSVSGSQTKPLSFEGGSTIMKFEGCEFKSSPYKKQVYFNALSATGSLDFTNCNFNNKTPNISFAEACPLTNVTMSGTTKLSSVTFETNRAKDAITEADWAHMSDLINKNSIGSVRIFYNGGSEYYYGM